MAAPLSNLSKPSNASIFPNSVLDIDKQILSYVSDPTVLVALSGTNRAAYQYLTNSEFFKNLFSKLHPQLAAREQTFQMLRENHPTNCWKVACSVLYKGEFKPGASFCAGIVDSLKEQKNQLEEELKKICGSGYADPNSPIDQAWKAYEKNKQAFEAMNEQRQIEQEELSKPLRLVHSSEQLSWIRSGLHYYTISQLFSHGTDGQIKDLITKGKLAYFDQSLISHYRLLHVFLMKKNDEFQKVVKLKVVYTELETRRATCETKLKQINQKLEFLPFTVTNHSINLENEFKLESRREKTLVSISIVKEILSHINACLEQHSTPADRLTRIRGLINSLDYDDKTDIWHVLYVGCANRVQEDQWSEKHFSEFLPQLKEIIAQMVIEYWKDYVAMTPFHAT